MGCRICIFKTGINAKAADRAKCPQKWPQACLQYQFVSKQLKYDDLDIKQFIADKLGIISEDDISAEEKQGQFDFLKKIVYYTVMYEFKGLKAYYIAFVGISKGEGRNGQTIPHI